MNLYMDDYRRCPPGFTLARDAEECLLLLREYKVEILSLDYDLGPGEPTGLEVAAGMVRERLFPEQIYLHSSSLSGRRQMYEMLYDNLPEGVQLCNHPVPPELLSSIEGRERR
ncbi:cell division protein FtsJ [Paenibacillus sp. P96]|uniref:Cell division protein FtsJ n=1 Tax=Paenibacillus zeirhizosphaerae TaxID=2987519 RepID=A0ABT9FVA9_9BACL|nr:cyclic-phosphate processing receiver domain-containing protein [Paenibacillus sp. P96]MDP4098625.1 cell division protein FtsJ [Paenibacillus sp. P96]